MRSHPQEHRPRLADGHVVAFGIQNPHLGTRLRATDAAGTLEPLARADDGPGGFGRAVVLPHDVAEPRDRRALDGFGARACAVHEVAHRAHVVARTDLFGQPEQAVQLSGDHVRRRDALVLDAAQHTLGVEPIGEDDGVAEVQRRHGEPAHGGVAERRRHQVHARVERLDLEHAELPLCAGREDIVGVAEREPARHTLGPARRSRRVTEEGSRCAVLRCVDRVILEDRPEVAEPRVSREREADLGREPRVDSRLANDAGEPGGREDRDGRGISDDVGDLTRGQRRVDRDVVRTALLAGEREREREGLVRDDAHHAVARRETEALEQMRESVHPREELAAADRRAVGLDDGDGLGIAGREAPEAELGHRGPAPSPASSSCASARRSARVVPYAADRLMTRLSHTCRWYSHVKPMPPCSWSACTLAS